MAKLTEEELRKIIQEELADIDEGILDRFLARTKGKVSSVGSGLKNIGKGAAQLYKGKIPKLADIGKVEKYTTVKNVLKQHEKKINPLLKDMISDIQEFGKEEEFQNIKAFKDAQSRAYHLAGTFTKALKQLDKDLKGIKGRQEQ